MNGLFDICPFYVLDPLQLILDPSMFCHLTCNAVKVALYLVFDIAHRSNYPKSLLCFGALCLQAQKYCRVVIKIVVQGSTGVLPENCEKFEKWLDGVYNTCFRFCRFLEIFLLWSASKFRFLWENSTLFFSIKKKCSVDFLARKFKYFESKPQI